MELEKLDKIKPENIQLSDFRARFTKEYLEKIKKTLEKIENDLAQKISVIANILLNARENKRTIFIMGNGGSASTASHFACDLNKLTIVEKDLRRFRTIALTDNVPSMLAWANDKCYEEIFVQQLKNLMGKNDVVIGISASGNSKNVLKAIKYANKNSGITIGLTGFDGGELLKYSKINVHISSHNMQRVEDIHLIIEHLLTSLIREELLTKKSC